MKTPKLKRTVAYVLQTKKCVWQITATGWDKRTKNMRKCALWNAVISDLYFSIGLSILEAEGKLRCSQKNSE